MTSTEPGTYEDPAVRAAVRSTIATQERELASLDTIWDKTIFKGQLLTDTEGRAVAELALAVAGARQTALKYKDSGTYDAACAGLLEMIVDKFNARFVDDFLTGTDDEVPEDGAR